MQDLSPIKVLKYYKYTSTVALKTLRSVSLKLALRIVLCFFRFVGRFCFLKDFLSSPLDQIRGQ